MNRITNKEALKRMIKGNFFYTDEIGEKPSQKDIQLAYKRGWVIVDRSGLKAKAFALPIN